MKFTVAIAAAALCFAAGQARADFAAAEAAYANKDVAGAFEQFLELAKLGHAQSQENVAVMYVTGDGVKRDNVLGYAWASIAKEQRGSEAVDGIIAQLESHLNDNARQRVTEIRDQFGRAALQARILPVQGRNAGLRTCTMKRPVNPDDYYPQSAVRSVISGQVLVETPVMPDGHARNPRVIYSIPKDVFSEAGRRVALDTLYAAPIVDGVAVRCTISFKVKFSMRGSGSSDDKIKEEFESTREKSAAGDPMSQFLHGLVLLARPELNTTGETSLPLFLKAAQGGVASAQFMVGYDTFNGFGMIRDETKGLFWLEKASVNGQVNAQVALANYLMRPGTTPADHGQAIEWLGKAVAGGNTDARYYLAALLAAGPEADKRDPQRALTLLGDVMPEVDVDPSAFEIRAAAQAMLGHFDEAQKDQKKALALAKKLGWDLKPLEERLARYTANQSWMGELMIY